MVDPDQTGQDFEALDDADPAAGLEAFRQEIEHARAAVAGKQLDDVVLSDGQQPAAPGVGLARGRDRGLAAFRLPARARSVGRKGRPDWEGVMAADHRTEIAATVAAAQELGSGYDQALAEGLVDRIGAEIDQRVAAEIGNWVAAEVDGRILAQLDRYAGCRHQRRRARRATRAERRMIRAQRADRSGWQTIMLALGSMLTALLVTAIVASGSPGVAAIMLVAVIWVIIGIINVVYAMREHPRRSARRAGPDITRRN